MARAAGSATTLDEVAQLAGRLRTELRRRGVHEQVARYCEEELLRRSLFHAVFESTKGVSDRLRQMTGLTADGAELVDQCSAFAGFPFLAEVIVVACAGTCATACPIEMSRSCSRSAGSTSTM